MSWDYYGQVVGTESRTMRLGYDEGVPLEALRAFVSVCEGLPGAADIKVEITDAHVRLTAEVRTSQGIPVDGPRLCSDCDGSGLAAHADDPCPTCAGTGGPLPAGDPSDYPTARLPIIPSTTGGPRG
ncbi:hypothetical protein [Nocardia sp. NPDC055049]